MRKMNHHSSTTDDGYLRSAEAIANFMATELGEPVRKEQIYGWIAKGHLQVGKFAGRMITTKAAIRERLRNSSNR